MTAPASGDDLTTKLPRAKPPESQREDGTSYTEPSAVIVRKQLTREQANQILDSLYGERRRLQTLRRTDKLSAHDAAYLVDIDRQIESLLPKVRLGGEQLWSNLDQLAERLFALQAELANKHS